MTLEHKITGRTIAITGSVDELFAFAQALSRKVGKQRFREDAAYFRATFGDAFRWLRDYEADVRHEDFNGVISAIDRHGSKIRSVQMNFGLHKVTADIDIGDVICLEE